MDEPRATLDPDEVRSESSVARGVRFPPEDRDRLRMST